MMFVSILRGMNTTIETQLAHRSIREFTAEQIPEQTMDTLFEVAMRTSTSRGLQHAALIRVKDQAKREELASIGKQPYIARAPELIVGIVDARRSVRIREEQGLDPAPAASAAVFREGFTDAVLMIQSMSVAAESLGLGVTHLGSILNDYGRLIEELALPRYTFPALGMMLGYPAQSPQLKPRIPARLRVMTDVYREPDSWMDALHDYDAEMHTYYDLREANRRVDAFTTQVARIAMPGPSVNFFRYVEGQGFDMGLGEQ